MEIEREDTAELTRRARELAAAPGRSLLGLTGAPGAGKSWLGEELREAVGDEAVVLPMDGFHLAQAVLDRRGLAAVKGRIDTFDAVGFVHLLSRVHDEPEVTVWAPQFRREIEEPIAGAIEIGPDTRLVIVEGNYLLAETPPWDRVHELLDVCWYLAPDETARRDRLLARHRGFGAGEAAARERTDGSDQHNAEVVAATRYRADLVVVG